MEDKAKLAHSLGVSLEDLQKMDDNQIIRAIEQKIGKKVPKSIPVIPPQMTEKYVTSADIDKEFKKIIKDLGYNTANSEREVRKKR